MQCAPHTLLENRTADVEWQVEPDGGRLHKSDHVRDDAVKRFVAANEGGLGKAVLKIMSQRIGVVAQQNGADTALTLGHQNGAQ